MFNLTCLGTIRAAAFWREHCISCFKESEHYCVSKALVKAKYSLKNTRKRSIYGETGFPLSHTTFFPFSWRQSFSVNFYKGFKTPPLSLPMLLCSFHEAHRYVLVKTHIFSSGLLSLPGGSCMCWGFVGSVGVWVFIGVQGRLRGSLP